MESTYHKINPRTLIAWISAIVAALLIKGVQGSDKKLQPGASLIAARQMAIEDSEYEINWQDRVGTYQSPNRRQNLRFTYYADGVSAECRNKLRPSDQWKVHFALESVNGLAALKGNKPANVAKKHLQVIHDKIIIEYQNEPVGLRQNFLISSKVGTNEGLEILLAVEMEEVIMTFDSERGQATFTHTSDLQGVLSYSDLKVWDATGKILPSRMVQTTPTSLALRIDDSHAEYPLTVDPALTGTAWTQDGSQTGEEFAWAVTFGNFTGAHSDAVAVGAPLFDGGSTDQGKVFVWYGGSTVATTSSSPDWTRLGENAYDHFGYAVACQGNQRGRLGNFDGSYYADLIVGAPNYSSGGYASGGKAYAFYTGASGLTANAADWSYTGTQIGAAFGWALAVGNVNSDSYCDLAVGAPFHGADSDGRVLVFKGPLSSTVANTYNGFSPVHEFGAAMVFCDFNLDGDDDLVVGAPYTSNGSGKLFVYIASSGNLPSGVTAVKVESEGAEYLGFSLARGTPGSGDHVIVGSPKWSTVNTSDHKGKVRIYEWTGSALSQIWSDIGDTAGD